MADESFKSKVKDYYATKSTYKQHLEAAMGNISEPTIEPTLSTSTTKSSKYGIPQQDLNKFPDPLPKYQRESNDDVAVEQDKSSEESPFNLGDAQIEILKTFPPEQTLRQIREQATKKKDTKLLKIFEDLDLLISGPLDKKLSELSNTRGKGKR
jgi:hypothetical protein